MSLFSDITKSWFSEMGSDSADSVYDHSSTLFRVAAAELLRHSRGIPDGFFDRAGVHLPPTMRNIARGDVGPAAIVPLGDVDPRVIVETYRVIREVFGLDAKIMRTRQPWPEAFVPKHSMLDADVILAKLSTSEYLDGCSRVIAITDMKMRAVYSATGRVHGYARLNDPTCVVTTGMMNFSDDYPNDEIPFRNFLNVTIHELGHTFGLLHCEDVSCVMKIPDVYLTDIVTNFCVRCSGLIIEK